MEDVNVDSTTTGPSLSLASQTSSEYVEYIEARNSHRAEKQKDFDDGLKKIEKRLAFPGSRGAVASVAASGQLATSIFQSILSSQNSNAMSAAAREAMKHLDRVLQCNSKAEQRDFLKYIEKIEMIPIHRLEDAELSPCHQSGSDWGLIKLAADMSRKAYDDNIEEVPDISVHKAFKAGTNTKPAVVLTHDNGNTKILVVTIRGTVTTDDWMLNVNGDPISSKAFNETTLWHQGFLKMALKMQQEIADIVEGLASQNDRPKQILFTGHSAGGAIAQILYALSMQTASSMARAIQGFSTVHCVTFAAPPVSTPPIVPDPVRNAQHTRGKFFSIINEGDPVPLAQREYIFALLDVYAKTAETLRDEDLNRFTVPVPVMRLSGQCLLLRDEDPSNWQNLKIRAYGVDADILQSKLFGNPLEHFMIEYRSRIYRVLDLQPPAEEELNEDL